MVEWREVEHDLTTFQVKCLTSVEIDIFCSVSYVFVIIIAFDVIT